MLLYHHIMNFERSFKKGVFIVFLLFIISCNNQANNNVNGDSYNPQSPVEEIVEGTPEAILRVLQEKDSTSLFERDSIKTFYKARANKPVWSDTQFRNAFLDTLKNAKYQGFLFEDFHGNEIENLTKNLQDRSSEEISALDIYLTDAFFKYGKQLWYGKTNPKKLHEIWDLTRKKISISKLLNASIDKNDLSFAIKKLGPINPIYNELILAAKEQSILMEKDSAKIMKIETGKTIKPESSDPRMPIIKARLQQLGYLKDADTSSVNSKTSEKAIKAFQQDHGLMIDGIIGNATLYNLNKSAKDWYNILQVNLERWRWYPRELGADYILVNVADFKLEFIKNGKFKEEHKIVVGLPSRATPVFSDEIENIVLNPSWYIPPTIKTKDVIPGARKDPNYINKKHLNVISQSGERLDPLNVNWNSKEVYSYRFKQDPGSANPLGQVKINFPNKHLIYLHDTNSKSLFSNNARSNSSGCVRVEGVIDLAKELLSDQKQYNSDKVDELLASGKTRYIKLTTPVKIYIFYWTAWRENGKTHFTHDIYNDDEKILKALNTIH